MTEALHLPSPCMVVLVGPGASEKSTWAAAHFPGEVVVSSDRLRALVGAGGDDVSASTDAFEVLEDVVRRRVARRLITVMDTLGLDRDRRSAWLVLARRHDLPCVAVAFDTPAAECRGRNRARAKRIPADALTAQLRTWPATRDGLADEGYDDVLNASGGAGRAGGVSSRPSRPPTGGGTGRPGCGSGCTSASSPRRRAAPRWAAGCATSPPRPSTPASTRSTSWTTSGRSRRSAGPGTTCWRAGPRWATWRPAPSGSGSGLSSPGSPTGTSPTSARSSPPWTC